MIGAFVPAEADGGGLEGLFFFAEMDGRGLVGLFPAEREDVTDPVAAALLAFCCFATDFRFLVEFPFAAFALPQSFGARPAGLIHPLPVVPVHDLPGGSADAAAVRSLGSRADLPMVAVAAAVAVLGIASSIAPGPEMRTKQ